jgi:hypothetical protein
LIRWLTGKEAPLYAKGYRWDLTEVPSKHPMVTDSEANAIADYFAERNKDSRVKVGALHLLGGAGSAIGKPPVRTEFVALQWQGRSSDASGAGSQRDYAISPKDGSAGFVTACGLRSVPLKILPQWHFSPVS